MTGLDVFNAIAARVPEKPVMSLLDALNAVISVLERRLLYYRSDLLQTLAAMTTDANGRAPLPDLFIGIVGNPYSGVTQLEPLSLGRAGLAMQGVTVAGKPCWYTIEGSDLLVSPVVSPTAIVLPCFIGLGKIASLSATLPLSVLLSQAYTEGALVLLSGVWPTSEPRFQQLLNDYVDVLIASRNRVVGSRARIPQYF